MLGSKVSEAARRGDDPLKAVDDADHEALGRRLAKPLTKMAKDGAALGLGQVLSAVKKIQAHGDIAKDNKGGASPEIIELLNLANDNAIEWANEHAAELVGMKLVDGKWVVNPDAKRAIDKTTREYINESVKGALEEGLSNDDLADELLKIGAFSDSRAEMIAVTETAFADLSGNRIGWRESGVVKGRKFTVGTDQIEICDDCLSMDGEEVGIDEEFPGGNAPRHPRCRCDEIPLVMSDEEIDAAAESAEE